MTCYDGRYAVDVVAAGKALGVPLTPCGLNADWCVEAWHIASQSKPNTVSGDLYILRDDDDGDLYQLVIRLFTGDNDTIGEIAEGDLQYILAITSEHLRRLQETT